MKPIKFLDGEKWKVVSFHKGKDSRYAISSRGRLIRYKKKIQEGVLVKGSMQEGYPIWKYSWFKKGVRLNSAKLFHHIVAAAFLPKQKAKQISIIHLNFKKADNRVENLKWATQEEVTEHNRKNPSVKKAIRDRIYNVKNHKLTEKNVVAIKSLLKKNKTLKDIAIKFGVSDMQIYRIKTGENWAHVK